MKIALNRLIVVVILIVSLLVNVFQFSEIKRCEKEHDYIFLYSIQEIYTGIENFKMTDKLVTMGQLASGTSNAHIVYSSTSYYKKNPMLNDTLSILNSNITNKNNIREVLETKDLTILIPALKKIIDDPLDEKATKELDYLVRKHTVIQ